MNVIEEIDIALKDYGVSHKKYKKQKEINKQVVNRKIEVLQNLYNNNIITYELILTADELERLYENILKDGVQAQVYCEHTDGGKSTDKLSLIMNYRLKYNHIMQVLDQVKEKHKVGFNIIEEIVLLKNGIVPTISKLGINKEELVFKLKYFLTLIYNSMIKNKHLTGSKIDIKELKEEFKNKYGE